MPKILLIFVSFILFGCSFIRSLDTEIESPEEECLEPGCIFDVTATIGKTPKENELFHLVVDEAIRICPDHKYSILDSVEEIVICVHCEKPTGIQKWKLTAKVQCL